ncbi:MAG: PEGA domain-containing protein [Candidatus Neomarinimicrobiota bacterium]
MGVNLKDVSYSVKQNGIMVNLDYTEPIDDDDIIGWKSDRGWVYLTLLGVRSPKGKKPQEDFPGVVRKIVIDDFDESTQLAILIRKPILGYDIINSKTSPSTIVFIHTEMKKSEVVSLKEYIKEEGTSVFNVAKSSGFPKYNTNFKSAFDEARKELGPNAIFEYHGKLYTTNHPGEKEEISESILVEQSKLNSKIDKAQPNQIDVFSPNGLIEETYVNIETGETITENLAQSPTLKKHEEELEEPEIYIETKEDDGWFSGLFPSFKNANNDLKSLSELPKQKDTTVVKEKPILVESLPTKSKKAIKWNKFFDFLKKRKSDKRAIDIDIVENKNGDADSTTEDGINLAQQQYRLLQERYIPTKNQNINLRSINDDSFIESTTQLSDTNTVAKLDIAEIVQSKNSDYQKLQKRYIPDHLTVLNDTLSTQRYYSSPTQAPDTNIVQAWFLDESIISDEYDATRLQKKYIPPTKESSFIEQEESYPYATLPQNTQSPDTNVVQAWFLDESIISDEYDATRLQKKYIPPTKESTFIEQEESYPYATLPQNTQSPDTNVVQAWFLDESIISDEYDVTRLQQKHIPSEKNNLVFNPTEDIYSMESPTQTPEFTDPIILKERIKTEFKNRGAVRSYSSNKETPFKEDSLDGNTWLSYFPLQNDSVKQSLKWDFRNEREVPKHLQNKRQSLDYYDRQNNQHQWRNQLSDNKPKSFPKRQTDPAFMYYHNGGIRVESNMDGVPIYIDGKYVGETPLGRPIQVEPGWHQVSGFSPVYTHLASEGGLQFVGYSDSIIQNNESYGATTVYAEAGKLETIELKFNKMGDTPKKWTELKGGINIGLPMFVFVMSMILYSM